MSFESIVLVAAWAIGSTIVLSVIAPALMPLRRDEAEPSYEDDAHAFDGPVIDAEPA